MKKVFISHPYADDPKGNKIKVDNICREITGECLPMSPLHAFSYLDNDNLREDVLQACKRIISVCDELWVYGDSLGCNEEVRVAKELGIKVIIKY